MSVNNSWRKWTLCVLCVLFLFILITESRKKCGINCLKRIGVWKSRNRRLPPVHKSLRSKKRTIKLHFQICKSQKKTTVRIVGGVKIDILESPYQVSLEVYGRHHCGGSIISKSFILTAAHCVHSIPAQHLQIRYGSTIRTEGLVAKNEKILIHSEYNDDSLDHDIALVKLQNSIIFSSRATTIQLPKLNEAIEDGTYGITTGWGAIEQNGGATIFLHKVTLPVIPLDDCRKRYRKMREKVTSTMLCSGYPEMGGMDACQGDSGGPFAISQTQVGIVSWGADCGDPFYPGVYTRVGSYRNWIDKRIGDDQHPCDVNCMHYEYPWNAQFRKLPIVDPLLQRQTAMAIDVVMCINQNLSITNSDANKINTKTTTVHNTEE